MTCGGSKSGFPGLSPEAFSGGARVLRSRLSSPLRRFSEEVTRNRLLLGGDEPDAKLYLGTARYVR